VNALRKEQRSTGVTQVVKALGRKSCVLQQLLELAGDVATVERRADRAREHEFKTWSQNLGHERVMTTFISYGSVDQHRQAQVMRELRRPDKSSAEPNHLARELAKAVLATGR
jgi:hypothetical protein